MRIILYTIHSYWCSQKQNQFKELLTRDYYSGNLKASYMITIVADTAHTNKYR